jgi:hypothetical protein
MPLAPVRLTTTGWPNLRAMKSPADVRNYRSVRRWRADDDADLFGRPGRLADREARQRCDGPAALAAPRMCRRLMRRSGCAAVAMAAATGVFDASTDGFLG